MAVSIFHRATGSILSLVGIPYLLWFLLAVAGGEESYALFLNITWQAESDHWFPKAANIVFLLARIVVSWAFFQHLLSGTRHLVLDTGAGYELQTNRFWSYAVFAGAIALTVILWVYIFFVRAGV